jgi:hypothetical protein
MMDKLISLFCVDSTTTAHQLQQHMMSGYLQSLALRKDNIHRFYFAPNNTSYFCSGSEQIYM